MSYAPVPNPFAATPGGNTGVGGAPLSSLFGGGGAWEVPGLRVAGGAPVLLHWSVAVLLAFFGFLTWSVT